MTPTGTGGRAGARRREAIQRGIVVVPSAFTLGNLFFGMYAMVSAMAGDVELAAWCIILASILDTLDGSIARLTRTGSRFGAELDSLVDAVSFGVAPALIAHQVFFANAPWAWLLAFTYVGAVVVRLARFNVEHDSGPKRYFNGLPSPAAGVLVASFHPFSNTDFFANHLAGLPWPQINGIAMVVLAMLLVSHVHYGKMPRIGLRSRRGVIWGIVAVGYVVLAVTVPRHFFFPATLTYVGWGLARSVILGTWERLPMRNPLLEEGDDEDRLTRPDDPERRISP